MTEVQASLRHVPKLAEVRDDCDPLYSCQLCQRRGTLEQLYGEECPKRSGVMRRRFHADGVTNPCEAPSAAATQVVAGVKD